MSASIIRSVLFLVVLLLSACAGARTGGGEQGAPEGAPSAVQHEALADLHLRAGRPDLAVAGYDKAQSLRPADAGLHVKRGRTLLRLNQPEPALEAFRAALSLSPDLPAALSGAGEALYGLERRAEAEPLLRRSLELAPESWRAHCLLGLVLEAGGRPELAVGSYLAALAAPGSTPARLDLLNNLGVAQAMSGDVEGGVRTLASAMLGGQVPEKLSNNLGLLLVRLGRYDEALAAFRASGDDPRALNNMGYALLLRGEAATAQLLFEKALQASPQYYETAGENLTRATLTADAPPAPAPEKRPGPRLLDPAAAPGNL